METLRVSASGQLDSLTDLTWQTASTSYYELVSESASKQFDAVMPRSPGVWFLRKKAGANVRADVVRHRNLVNATDVPGGVEVMLSTRDVPRLDDFVLDTGPYEQDSYSPRRIVLRRRSPGVPSAIEVLSRSTEAEEWRRFLAREVDVVPLAFPGQISHLRDLPSVNVAYYSDPSSLALFFRTESGPFADAAARRRVSTGIRRKAIAFATGDVDGAIASTETPAEMVPGPNVRLIFDVARSDQERAASVLEEQLLALGYSVTITGLEVQQLVERFANREFDLLLLPSCLSRRCFDRALTGNPSNVTGYSNPDFDAAAAAGDDARAADILRRDVPFTLLYSLREAAALDSRFCGAHPSVSYDFAWLAQVHPCASGEKQ